MRTFHIKRRRNRHILLLVEIEPYIKRQIGALKHLILKRAIRGGGLEDWRPTRLKDLETGAYKTKRLKGSKDPRALKN
jgi:hypothetical protein